MRLLLGDEHRLFIEALAVALRPYGFAVTALASTPEELLAALASQQPDVCVVGALPASGRVDVLRMITRRGPAVKVVMLLNDSDAGVASAATGYEAAAFITKEQHVTSIADTLARVGAGDRLLHHDQPRTRGCDFQASRGGDVFDVTRFLTGREQEVLMLMMEGLDTKQIAWSLTVAVNTARTHVQNMLVKLGAHSRLEAITIAARSGLISPSGRRPAGHPAWGRVRGHDASDGASDEPRAVLRADRLDGRPSPACRRAALPCRPSPPRSR